MIELMRRVRKQKETVATFADGELSMAAIKKLRPHLRKKLGFFMATAVEIGDDETTAVSDGSPLTKPKRARKAKKTAPAEKPTKARRAKKATEPTKARRAKKIVPAVDAGTPEAQVILDALKALGQPSTAKQILGKPNRAKMKLLGGLVRLDKIRQSGATRNTRYRLPEMDLPPLAP